MARYGFTFILILLAALSRLLPHPPNFAPITALALFGGVYLDRKHTFIVPIAAMLISDYFIGFYTGMMWVYASFTAIGFIGLWLRNHRGVVQTVGATLAGSVLFFVVTNFGVWISSQVSYPHNFAGLVECYVAAIPFFRNTVLGDALYVTAMFGLYELAVKFIPRLSPHPKSLKA
ncbi:MAG: hypothetical protein HY033_04505 [Ignavibacteriae bacterium]|nr:hypothetical protein [Ignavibacteria bacterium]MBI3364150.1 hypothetical protein [Ignavibacteriota bacterium]